jgi:protein phosphatase
LRTAAKGIAVIAVIGAVIIGAWYGLRQVWFLGTDQGGRVALYRGLPYELPFGIKLYGERYSTPIQTESLPKRRRESVTGHDLRSRSDAVSLIEDIEAAQWPQETAPRPPKPEKGQGGK